MSDEELALRLGGGLSMVQLVHEVGLQSRYYLTNMLVHMTLGR